MDNADIFALKIIWENLLREGELCTYLIDIPKKKAILLNEILCTAGISIAKRCGRTLRLSDRNSTPNCHCKSRTACAII